MKIQIQNAIKRLFIAGSDMTKQVTVTVKTGGTFNPATGKTTGATNTNTTINGFLQGYNQKDIDGTVIKTSDQRLLIEKGSFLPKTGGKVTVDGIAYNIVNVREVLGICYSLQIRT